MNFVITPTILFLSFSSKLLLNPSNRFCLCVASNEFLYADVSLKKLNAQILETKINSEVFLNNLLKAKNSEFEALSNKKLALEEIF